MKKVHLVWQLCLCLLLVFGLSTSAFAAEESTATVQPLGSVEALSSVQPLGATFQGQQLRNILTALGVPEDMTIYTEQFRTDPYTTGKSEVRIDAYYGKNLVACGWVDYFSGKVLRITKYYSPTIFSMNDVKPGDWYYNNVKFCYDYALMSGTSRANFEPYSTTSRAMLATILWRLEGSPSVYGNKFYDLTQSWYVTAVNWAAQNKIVNGYGNGMFGPEDPITREDMATMLYRYATTFGYDMSLSNPYKFFTFYDCGTTSNYAQTALQWACSEGLIYGMDKPANTIQPRAQANRAQMATILYRFANRYSGI